MTLIGRPPRDAIITPDMLARIGEALYGSLWQNAMARDLEISERSVRYFLSGERPIHEGIVADLLRLVEDREIDLHDLAKELRKAIKAAG